MSFVRTVAASAALGGLGVAAALTLELVVVALVSTGIGGLSWAPPGVFAAGLLAGAALGALLALFRLALGRGGGHGGSIAWENGFWVTCLGGCYVVLVQGNFHLLPDFFSIPSLAFTMTLLAGTIAFARGGGRRVAAAFGPRAPVTAPLATALLGFGVLAGVSWLFVDPGAGATAEPWAAPSLDYRPSDGDDVSTSRPRDRLLVIGIDGAHWERLDPLLAAGRLPNLERLLETGKRGVLYCEEGCVSPIAWTTIFTGRPPAEHGITGWDVSISTNRRVSALWNILDRAERTSYVSHVPSTFPAEKIRGGMIAGFPLPEGVVPQHRVWMDKTYSGWLVYRGGPPPSADGPVSVPLRSAELGQVTLGLSSLDPPIRRTSLFLATERFARASPGPGMKWRRWLRETSRRLGLVPMTTVLELVLDRREGATGEVRIVGSTAMGEELFDLAPGEWGPWLAVGFEAKRFLVRPRLIHADGDGLRLYMTPLLAEQTPGGANPAELGFWVLRPERPYFVVGAGTEIYHEPAVLDAFAEHHLQLEGFRAEAALDLMREAEWDVFIHHFVVTDWFSHVFAQFESLERFGSGPTLRYGPYTLTPERVRDLAGYVDHAYERVDAWAGKLLDNVDESTTVVLLSDHGSKAPPVDDVPPARGGHRREGIYAVTGPSVPSMGAPYGPRLNQVDALPLLLAYLGLPAARDMPGVVPDVLWPRTADGARAPRVEPIESYDSGDASAGVVERLDESTREMLRSLGYIQ